MNLIITNPDELKSMISEAVKSAFAGLPTTCTGKSTADFLTEKQACEYLTCKKNTLYKLVKEGKIIRIQLAQRRTAYSRENLANYMNGITQR